MHTLHQNQSRFTFSSSMGPITSWQYSMACNIGFVDIFRTSYFQHSFALMSRFIDHQGQNGDIKAQIQYVLYWCIISFPVDVITNHCAVYKRFFIFRNVD